jgi:hypothetical protein
MQFEKLMAVAVCVCECVCVCLCVSVRARARECVCVCVCVCVSSMCYMSLTEDGVGHVRHTPNHGVAQRWLSSENNTSLAKYAFPDSASDLELPRMAVVTPCAFSSLHRCFNQTHTPHTSGTHVGTKDSTEPSLFAHTFPAPPVISLIRRKSGSAAVSSSLPQRTLPRKQ